MAVTRRQLLRAGGVVLAGTALPGCAALMGPPPQQACGAAGSDLADNEIPADVLDAYQQAARDRAVPWTVLAAIGWVESRHKPQAIGPPLDGGPGIKAIPASDAGTRWHGDAQWERAVGLTQTLPGTFRRHRPDADADPFDPRASAAAAAAYLGDVGADQDLAQALYRYNNSWGYVDDVLAKAAEYDATGAIPSDCTGQQPQLVSATNADPEAVIANPHVRLDSRAAADLRHPRMDPRVIALLQALAEQHRVAVSVVKTGHSRCVGGGSNCPDDEVSHHWHYRAVDIWSLDGQPVNAFNRTARDVVQWASNLSDELRPDEIGSPFGGLTHLAGVFTDSDHDGHIHIGYAASTE